MSAELIVATEALADGRVTRRELTRDYTRLFQNVHVRRGTRLTARDKAVAAWLWSGRSATVAGSSAAALLGTRYLDARAPAELIRTHRRAPKGISVSTDAVDDREQCRVGDMIVTTPSRTAFDIGRRHSIVGAVQCIDALMQATACRVEDVRDVGASYPGARGSRRLRTVLRLVDPGAESPHESLTRLVLLAAGLPRPSTQIPIVVDGRVRYRLDMGWPAQKVAVEYDGGQHWTDPRQRARDIERLEFLAALGWTIIRVSWTQLRDQPQRIVDRVAAALRLRTSVQVSHANLAFLVQNLHARRPIAA